MKKIILIIFIVIFPVYAFGDIGVGLLSEQIGIEHGLSLRMNNGYYHKIFSLGKGPFNPAPGAFMVYTKDEYFGYFSFSYSQQSMEGYFDESIGIVMINLIVNGGYKFLFRDKYYVAPVIGVGLSSYSIFYNNVSKSDEAFNIRALIEGGYLKKIGDNLTTFVSLSLGIQNPINFNMDEAGVIKGEPYLYIIRIGLLSR